MRLNTVGILSPGDMGHTVGHVLNSHGLHVITCLQGRSQRTKSLAQQANIEDVPDYQTLVYEADMILSILVPAQAKQAAQVVANAHAETKGELIYVDCNAVSPQAVRQVGEIITQAGGHFVDASIIGPPPRTDGLTRFYASGPYAGAFEELNRFGLDVRVLDDQIGRASAIKMCYAALTKGLAALSMELLIAAEVLGVSDALREEFRLSQSLLYERMERQLTTMPMKSRRWVGEMEEIAETFAHVGLTPKILEGAADIYRFVGKTPLADQMPENRDMTLTLTQQTSIFVDSLDKNA